MTAEAGFSSREQMVSPPVSVGIIEFGACELFWGH